MERQRKIIATWLYIGLAMVVIQILLGGITRLTGSGLSITEWKPILGAMYPANENQWQEAFSQYKTIAQYQYLNADYTLADFKFIFFWEWLHRNWARFIGIVFFIPFLFFILKGYINKENGNKFIILFLVGALQGLVGWVMVASGINNTNLYVNHFKLAAHFLTALLALVFIFWLIQDYTKITLVNATTNLVRWSQIMLVLLVVQLFFGALMAGLKAAQAAPTWPTINGELWPAGMWGKSIFNHPILVHFMHRGIGYLIALVTILFICKAKKNISLLPFYFYWPLILVIIQIVLGVASVLYAPNAVRNNMGTFEWAAQIHQLTALFLLLSWVKLFYVLKKSVVVGIKP